MGRHSIRRRIRPLKHQVKSRPSKRKTRKASSTSRRIRSNSRLLAASSPAGEVALRKKAKAKGREFPQARLVVSQGRSLGLRTKTFFRVF